MKEYNSRLIEKANKPFMKKDVFVYVALILLSLLLFFLVGIGKTDNEKVSYGFTVSVDNEVVLTCDFAGRSVKINKETCVLKMDETTYKIQSEYGYNILEINFENSSVKVVESDCGLSKECAYMNLSDGIIICAPHKLVIKSSESNGGLVIG